MMNLTYNIIVNVNRSSYNYWERIEGLARQHDIQEPLIVCATDRIVIVDFSKKPLQFQTFKGKPRDNIPKVVRAYEAHINGTETPRWVIAQASLVERVKNGLVEIGAFKDNRYYVVQIGDVYGANGTSENGQDYAKRSQALNKETHIQSTTEIPSNGSETEGVLEGNDPKDLFHLVRGVIADEKMAKSRLEKLAEMVRLN